MATDKDEVKQAPKAPQRFHKDSDGTMRKVVDTYYDPKRNVVIDVFEVERFIRDADKKRVKVTTRRKTASQDKALQKKYRIEKGESRREVTIDG